MKRIYLDQNMWIYLAQARVDPVGHQEGAGVLRLAGGGVETGLVSFPLSAIHYIETASRRWDNRQDLAKTMALLSHYCTIAPLTTVVPPEMDRALQTLLQTTVPPRELNPFDKGFRHAMNQDFPVLSAPPTGLPRTEALYEAMASMTEWAMLAGLPPGAGVDETALDEEQREVGNRLAKEQEQLRLARRREGWHSGERSKRLASLATLAGWTEELAEAMNRAGVLFEDLKAKGKAGLIDLQDDIPSLHVGSELVRQREAARDTPWTRNDVNDVYALSVAIVYCDVVVTELQWVDLATRSRLHERYGTVLLKSLAELTPLLADD